MRGMLGFVLLAVWAGVAFGADSSAALTAKQTQAKAQQEQLRERIGAVQKKIDSQESSRKDAANSLKASESAISSINRRLSELAHQKHEAEQKLAKLAQQIVEQKHQMALRQAELADQLRAQYASGLSPWTALLSGDDPQAIGRDLSYLSYISAAQADAVRAVRAAIDQLAALQQEVKTRRKELVEVADETARQKTQLEKQQQERQQVLHRIEAELKQERNEAERLARNDKRLGKLISGLDDAIEKQAEQERKDRERRKAEEARRAEQARKAAQERQREIERQRQAARLAQRQAQEAQALAQRQKNEEEAREARLQVERARAQVRDAEQAARQEQTKSKSIEPPSSASTQSFQGLKKGLPLPVNGEVQGRFGASRPEGGLWRGIVLRASEGTNVHVVAAGRVVYANWLNGFGNIIIVDHGAKYLSVYAYNQSLLKKVGDVVRAKDVIATVGATGGQVESGLYFEIRHNGVPVNPLLWLRQ